jgi:hypothetical protein
MDLNFNNPILSEKSVRHVVTVGQVSMDLFVVYKRVVLMMAIQMEYA